MEQVVDIAQYVLTIGGALVVIIFVIILLYVLRFVLMAVGIIKTAKKTVESAEQSLHSLGAVPTGLLSSLFSSSGGDDESDDI